MAGVFERELKGILQGDEAILKKATKSCDEEECAGYHSIQTKPFIVIRAAGSLGVDLVAVRGDISFPIEVKASKVKRVHFSDSPRLTEQAMRMKADAEKAGVIPLYALRLKGIRGDSWRVFAMRLDVQLEGANRVVYKRIPKLGETKSGNLMLNWDEGMPLHVFLDYISR